MTDRRRKGAKRATSTPVDAGWLTQYPSGDVRPEGLVQVQGYDPTGRPPHEVSALEKAAGYGARAVFFEAGNDGDNGAPQAFVFVAKDADASDERFAEIHQRLWSWGGVPLVYRHVGGAVQLFRCAHRPDFAEKGRLVCRPFDILRIGADVANAEAWWDARRLRTGTLWDDPAVAEELLSSDDSAPRRLVAAVRNLRAKLLADSALEHGLQRRLLILSLLVAYLDQRDALPNNFFPTFLEGADTFAAVLADGPALLKMLAALKILFNGDVFALDEEELEAIGTSTELAEFSRLVEAREERSGQMNLWALYSFRDLPVEVISNIYELFVSDPTDSVYTPPALVRLILDEVLDETRIDRILDDGDVALDPACGSGIFLVETFKRIVMRWRARNGWARPGVKTLRDILRQVHGVDNDSGAIELATFSLCLAMCDNLTPEEIRATPELFPKLLGSSLTHSCFFTAKHGGLLSKEVAVLVGNPPFKSGLKTKGAKTAYAQYVKDHGKLPDLQVAYLFLHESMKLLRPGGILGMLQQYNLLYNEKPDFRKLFLASWNVREVLDFVSVRGLFSKDTKVVTVVAVAEPPPPDGSILHAVFRRTARADASQRFDIDIYDLHRIPRIAAAIDHTPDLWRSNLLGGARTYAFVKRLREMPSLAAHAKAMGWDYGEGFIEGGLERATEAKHLRGQPVLPSEALTLDGIDRSRIGTVEDKPIERPRNPSRFTPPMLLVREHADLPNVLWTESYLTYRTQIVGFPARRVQELEPVAKWLRSQSTGLRAYVAAISVKMLSQKATSLSARDIYDLPFDPDADGLELSVNEFRVAQDIVDHYLDYVRLGSSSPLAHRRAADGIEQFVVTFAEQVNALYPDNPLRPSGFLDLGGTVIQAFAFGEAEVDWSQTEQLTGRLDALLCASRGSSLTMTRVARVYDASFVFLLKPDRLRYWLPSVALKDADDVLADLRDQGF